MIAGAIHARAPLRIVLGGGTEPGGAAVFAAVSLGVHVELLLGGRTIRLRAEDRNLRVTLTSPAAIAYDGRLDRPKAALNMLPVTGGIELLTRVDVPHDAGLGEEGALDVALLAALALCRRERYAPAELADLACMLEATELQRSLDREDAYVPAFGGVQLVTRREDRVDGWAVGVTADRLAELAAHLIVAYLGRAYVSGVGDRGHGVGSHLASAVVDALRAGDWPRLAQLFDEGWRGQQALDALLSSPHTRSVEHAARAAGAWGLRATTSGSGGSLLVLCDPRSRSQVAAALRGAGAQPRDCTFDAVGVRTWLEGGDEA